MKAFVLVHGVHHLVSEEVKFINDNLWKWPAQIFSVSENQRLLNYLDF